MSGSAEIPSAEIPSAAIPSSAEASFSGKYFADHDALAARVAEWQRQGLRIVFSNGVFDILHVGHIRCLRDARSRGDRLILALNSDASTRANKGPHLPIVPELERVEVLSALDCVDALTLFSDRTVDRLLLLLKPDVYAKGSEYTPETIPETPTVRSYGGSIALVGDPKGHSSSWIIKKIRAMPAPS